MATLGPPPFALNCSVPTMPTSNYEVDGHTLMLTSLFLSIVSLLGMMYVAMQLAWCQALLSASWPDALHPQTIVEYRTTDDRPLDASTPV